MMLREARRVLKPKGAAVIAFIDRASHLGREYDAGKAESRFYREAVFLSAGEVDRLLARAGFGARVWRQTLSEPLTQAAKIEEPRAGFGEGAFVVVKASRDAT
jgi:hypothetical protein